MVGSDGALPLPWLAEPLRRSLHARQGHALLIHGARGVGQFELLTTLAQAWLCEDPGSDAAGSDRQRPCGNCAACRLVQAHSHPDMLVLLPEALRNSLGWAVAAADADAASGGGEKASKARPSRDIKVDAVRLAVAFAQTTSARGRGKVVVVHPAERMNAVAANTLLKTLEEPPGDARFVLGCAAPDALLPTIRSRCQALALGLPPTSLASAWLARHGVAQPEVLLAAAGGQPLEALEWSRQGIDAALWARLPSYARRGDATLVAAWPLALLVEALQKLCHDAACRSVDAAPRYFAAEAVAPGADLQRLGDFHRELQRIARHVEHPWNAGLMADSLLQQAARALAAGGSRQGASLHSAA